MMRSIMPVILLVAATTAPAAAVRATLVHDDGGGPTNNSSATAAARRSVAVGASAFDSWTTGRATWYGGPGGPGPDGMSIYTGSCGLGSNIPAPYFIAAAQTMGGYNYGLTNECGQCFEVVCVPGRMRGTPTSSLGPGTGCASSSRSVVVKITDSCPCNHPNKGNKRWCCGDELHLDLSYAAFEAIGLKDKGVIDLKIRPASCDLWGETIHY